MPSVSADRFAVHILYGTIDGVPKGRSRHRCMCLHGKARTYAKPSVAEHEWELAIRRWGDSQKREIGKPWDGPVAVSLIVYMQRPKAHHVGNSRSRPVKASAPDSVHAQKPDVDNLLKLLLDELTGRLWIDDNQVSDCSISKRWASEENPPGCSIEVVLFEAPYTP